MIERMGKRRRHSSRDSLWTREYGGMPVWGLGLAAAFLLLVGAVAVPAALSQPEPSEASEARPLPSMYAPEAKPVAVFIGDSYTAGANSTAPAKRFSTIVAREAGWDEVNLAAGGTGYLVGRDQDPELAQIACARDYCPAYPEVIDAAVEAAPEIVVVNGGRNNSQSDPDDLRTGIPQFFEDLRAALPDAQILATSPVWDSSEVPAQMELISSLVESSVQAVDGTFIDIGEPLQGKPDLIAGDRVHPNDAGHAELAQAVLAGLPSSD